MEKPDFPKKGQYSYEQMSKYTEEELLEFKQYEKDSEGTILWYFFPSNIKKLIEYCLNVKRHKK